jgi:hypothetical protein
MTTPFYADPARGCSPEKASPAERAWFTSDHRSLTNRAKTLCRSCPVQQACLDHALAAGEREHVWGGVLMSSVGERRQARLYGTDIAQAIVGLWQQGLTDVAIAAQLHVSHGVIRENRRRLGLPGNFRGRPAKQAVAA